MKIAYYLNEGRKKNLYCRISDGADRVSFSLGYGIDPEEWNAKKEEGSFEDPYYYTLMSFKKYLSRRYHELKSLEVPISSVLATLKQEAETFIDGSGIDGIARKMFDDENKAEGFPTYDQFVEAFEKHSSLTKGEYKVRTIGNIIHFHTDEAVYEMDTYQGLSARLSQMVDRRSYDEIFTMTDEAIWSEIYIDAGIDKYTFLPALLREWERFWHSQYKKIKEEIGRTDHLDDQKQASWRQLQVFMECYSDAGDIIELAHDINDIDLYPMVVITMLNIFDADTCYTEYCEEEFYAKEDWESISLLDDDELDLDEGGESPIFFIKEAYD